MLAQLSNADIAKINALDINARVSEAVIDVFDTMLSLKLEPADAVSVETLEGIRNVGSVSFAGDANGMISIHAGDSFSREMAAEMLGMEVEEIEGDEEIRDMLGEIGQHRWWKFKICVYRCRFNVRPFHALFHNRI